jgi:hypothetical protein
MRRQTLQNRYARVSREIRMEFARLYRRELGTKNSYGNDPNPPREKNR